ncbi:MAG TPA: tripartite tricarboxylate transporter substrate binding protein [Pseudolabrys sp.]|jgi:tripartite-type tricarboxylate transporter receptor subunit TctC|nr:tripartite tricarboxylate transporter substrate binding protein [Pseudolabrys sp.]
MRRGVLYLAIGLAVANLAATVDAQEYPNRPVHVLAAAAPGGNPDVLARLLSQRLADVLGQPFVVENVPGAGGILAAKRIAEASPDGYLLMLNDSGALAININMSPDANYQLKDFAPITALATVPTALVIIPSVPASNVNEFIALAKSKPGMMSFGSAGAGSIHHLTMEIFAERTGINLLHVPYRGGTALVNGLLTGEIQAGWSGLPNVISHIKAGTLRGLCVSVLKRAVSLPDVPTCDEVGIKGFDIADMLGLQAPAGMSPKAVERLQAAIAKIMREPAMAERMETLGMDLQENGTANYARFMHDDLELYAKVIDRLGLSRKASK